MSGIVKVDGVPEPMQPNNWTWEQPRRLGTTGNGKPVFAPYWKCKLAFSRMTTVQYDRWLSWWQDGEQHTFRLSHPGSGSMTDFTGRVLEFNQRVDATDRCIVAANGVDIVVGHIEVS